MSLPSHGANPDQLLQALHTKPQGEIIDFSVNTNPLGVPYSLQKKWGELGEAAFLYPDPEVKELRARLALKHQLAADELLVTNGAAEAFFLIASVFSGKRVGILEPTFVEYEQASKAFQCEITKFRLDEDRGWQWPLEELLSALPNLDLLWVCHPNNPTGVAYEEEQWIVLLEKARSHRTCIVIDEAFIDFMKWQPSFIRFIKEGYPVILVRSMTKMYHIAGIRLGYVMTSKSLINQMKEKQPPWSVNGVAQSLGLSCLEDSSFTKRTVDFLEHERQRVFEQLKQLNLTFSLSAANYYLCSVPEGIESRKWLSYLASQGIIARHTENFPGLDGRYIRLAVKTYEENEKLLHVIRRGLENL